MWHFVPDLLFTWISGYNDENRLKGGKVRCRETSEGMKAIIQLRDKRGLK